MGANDAAMDIVLSAKDQTAAGVTSAEGKLAHLKGSVAGLMAAWSAAGAAVTAGVGFLSDAANAAAQDAASTDRLRKAVENSGGSWEKQRKAIEDRIAAGQDLAFTDDQTRDSLSLLIAQTGDVDEALRRQKLAMDLSRGANIDVVTASKLLGKVTDENVNVLKKYGINVEKGADQTVLFGLIQQKFGGQAKVYGDSQAGTIDRIKDKIGEWKESIGAALGPAQTYIALLPGMTAGFTLLGTVAGPVAEGIKLFGNTAAFAAIKSGVVRAATLAWTAVQWLLNVALSANPIGLVIVGIAALAAGIIWAYKNIGPFHVAVDAAFSSLKLWASWITTALRPILQWLGDRVQDIAGFIGGIVKGAQGLAKTAHDLHVPGFDWGGKVPGPVGAPMLVKAHGGETVLTAGESRMREQMSTPAAVVSRGDVHVHIGSYIGDRDGPSKLSKLLAKELRLQGAFS